MARGSFTLGSKPGSFPGPKLQGPGLGPTELLSGAAGRIALGFLFLVPLAASFFAVFSATGGSPLDLAYAGRALLSSILTAFASALLALLIGFPGAWLLARVDYRGKAIHAGLQAVPLAFPPVLFILGFISIWGSEGAISSILSAFGAEYSSSYLYSPGGVIFAQACYNAPLASLILAKVWESLGRNRMDAARSLGASRTQVFFRLSFPALRGGILASFSIIFIFCFMSFVIPMTLGGGPKNEGLEVSIYSAIRNSLDFRKAGLLSLIETLVAFAVLLLYLRSSGSSKEAEGFGAAKPRLSSLSPLARTMAYGYIALEAFLSASPVLGLAISSFQGRASRAGELSLGTGAWETSFADPGFWSSLGGSILVALPSAAIAVLLSLCFVYGSRRGGKGSYLSMLPMASSATVLALGYLILFPAGGNPLIYAAVAAASSLPLAYRLIHETRSGIPQNLGFAARSLGAGKLRAFTMVDAALLFPALRCAFALAVSAALGELNSQLILPSLDFSTLTQRSWRLMGAYRFDAAAVSGVILALLAGFAFAYSTRKGRKAA